MMCDNHSGCAWLYPTPSENAEEAANALIDGCAASGPPITFMFDSLKHFRNETFRLLARVWICKHDLTQASCPRRNGAAERLGNEILVACPALTSKLQPRVDSWPDVVPLYIASSTTLRHHSAATLPLQLHFLYLFFPRPPRPLQGSTRPLFSPSVMRRSKLLSISKSSSLVWTSSDPLPPGAVT